MPRTRHSDDTANSGFWAGGADAYQAHLDEEYQRQMSRLRIELQNASDDGRRQELRVELREIEVRYREKTENGGYLLF